MSRGMLSEKQATERQRPMQDDRIARYRDAAEVARMKAITANDPKQWNQIADAWDQLARQVEALNSPKLESLSGI